MNKLLKIGIPLVFIGIIIIIIFYNLGYIKINLGESFNDSTKSICKPLVLKNIEYDYTVDRNNFKKLYVSEEEKDNYYALIENNQPYGFFPDYKLDTDELNEVKLSSQYVWCLNMNRNQITKFDNFKGFKWHAQEQATFSILFYQWKYNFKKSQSLISIHTPKFREISFDWNILDLLKFIKNSLKFYFNFGLIFALKERILICKKNFEKKEFFKVNSNLHSQKNK